MTNFEILYAGVQKIERGYDADDQGAPAYNGINRRYHAAAFKKGWDFLDKMKQAGKLKQGSFFPELEPEVKAFYKNFWAPVKVDQIREIKLAQLLVDMKTQHGYWARVVKAGIYGKSPFDNSVSNVFTDQEVKLINAEPVKYYKAIAAARLQYAKNVSLKNEADRKGIIARAQKYFNDAVAWVKENPTSGATALIVTFFFWL